MRLPGVARRAVLNWSDSLNKRHHNPRTLRTPFSGCDDLARRKAFQSREPFKSERASGRCLMMRWSGSTACPCLGLETHGEAPDDKTSAGCVRGADQRVAGGMPLLSID